MMSLELDLYEADWDIDLLSEWVSLLSAGLLAMGSEFCSFYAGYFISLVSSGRQSSICSTSSSS